MGPFPEQHTERRLGLFGRGPSGRRETPGRLGSPRTRRASRMLAAGCGAAALAVVAAACGGSSSGNSGGGATGGTPVKGGTVTFAELPGSTPNYIFPFTNSSYFSVANAELFQYMIYRPLYWFGTGENVNLNKQLSLADPPSYSGTTVTVKLKPGWKWSNGEPVDAQDLEFWMNMEKAEKTNWGDYTPGFFPDNITGYKVVSPTEFQLTTNKVYNPTWFTDNELAQITPMPKAWDRTASGSSDCMQKVSDCTAVYNYLNNLSKDVASYPNSPVWSVVDGPWKLQSLTTAGQLTLVPNPKYSGSPKPKIAKFVELPFTTEDAEYNELRSGNAITVGYIPTNDVPTKPANATVGPNPVSGDTLAPWRDWSISYSAFNMANPSMGAVFRQTYFRQAVQYLMNQASIIKGPGHGYGTVTTGPVPSWPPTPLESPQEKAGDPFPYNPGNAKQLLASHGWKIAPNGTDTCQNPSLCGAGVKQGQALSFQMLYATGINWMYSEVVQLQSNLSKIGIKMTLRGQPFDTVVQTAGPNCVAVKVSCAWQAADWGAGWIFVPDYDPTGETLFQTGATANNEDWSNATNDAMIQQTLTSSSLSVMYNWENYVAKQAPLIWQPNLPYQMTEISNKLRGVTPQSATLNINPENWYFVK